MMSLNRYRLSAWVKQGRRGAKEAGELLGQTDKLLGTILLGNNIVNTALTTLVTALAIKAFGSDDTVLLVATASVAFMIIVFCEITPKVIGATYPDRIALPASFLLRWLMKISQPFVWFVNLFVGWLLKLMRIDTGSHLLAKMTSEELRAVVLESGQFMPQKHRSIVMNLFELENITVDDVMTPRAKVEAIDITDSAEQILEQLTTCYHNKLPVFEREVNQVIGILHVRKALALVRKETFDPHDLRELLTDPYFVPSETPVFTQLQFFQENKQRVALVVDEYGEVLGMVTLDDIVEEMVGKFTTTAPGREASEAGWGADHEVTVEGSAQLRDLNRRLGTAFSLDGPKTINGWMLEQLQELPDGPASARFGDVAVEIIHIQGRTIRSLRLTRLARFKSEHVASN